MKYKWIKPVNKVWHLKNTDYETTSKAEKIEDKLDILLEVVNYLLEEQG